MKRKDKFFPVLLIILLAFAFPFAAFAGDFDDIGRGRASQAEKDGEEKRSVDKEEDKEDDEGENNRDLYEKMKDQLEERKKALKEQEGPKPWELAKDIIEQEKDAIEQLKDQIEDQIEILEEQLEAAEERGDSALAVSLKVQIEQLKLEKDAYREQIKQKIEAMHEVMKEKYTPEELAQLDILSKRLTSLYGIKAIPVTNIFVRNGDIKFDTPPVIKEGRVLIPLRAISNATGATVQWNSEEKTITVTKDDKVIVMKIDEAKIIVNNVEITIDVPGQIINNRTVVPLRFIVENLGLQVNWDAETETIEVE